MSDWTEKENLLLIDAVKKYGYVWNKISANIPNRTNHQCCSHWHNVIMKRNDFNYEITQDIKYIYFLDSGERKKIKKKGLMKTIWLIKQQQQQNNTEYVINNNENEPEVDLWNLKQDALLMSYVKIHGTAWEEIAKKIPGKTDIQCKCRFYGILENRKRKSIKWTKEEDACLISAIEKHGIKWKSISDEVRGRTSSQCKCRWYKVLKEKNNKLKQNI